CCFEEELLTIVMAPADDVLRGIKGAEFIATKPGEMFFTSMKVDIVAGIFFAAPAILLILWGFVARGLYPRERRWGPIYVPISCGLFVAGCLFFYFVIQPYTLQYLLSYHADMNSWFGRVFHIAPKLKFEEAVNFFLSMTLVTGVIFELPLVMLFLQAI